MKNPPFEETRSRLKGATIEEIKDYWVRTADLPPRVPWVFGWFVFFCGISVGFCLFLLVRGFLPR